MFFGGKPQMDIVSRLKNEIIFFRKPFAVGVEFPQQLHYVFKMLVNTSIGRIRLILAFGRYEITSETLVICAYNFYKTFRR